jgi:membrane protein implicated in regulation of membrane protease activity
MLFWIFIGIALLLLELLTLSFFIVFFGIAALSVALIVAFISLNLAWQIFIFSALSLVYFILGKKFLKKTVKSLKEQDLVIGSIGVVTQTIHLNDVGKVLVGDTHWNAISTSSLQKGDKVRIVAVNSLTLEVVPL